MRIDHRPQPFSEYDGVLVMVIVFVASVSSASSLNTTVRSADFPVCIFAHTLATQATSLARAEARVTVCDKLAPVPASVPLATNPLPPRDPPDCATTVPVSLQLVSVPDSKPGSSSRFCLTVVPTVRPTER